MVQSYNEYQLLFRREAKPETVVCRNDEPIISLQSPSHSPSDFSTLNASYIELAHG